MTPFTAAAASVPPEQLPPPGPSAEEIRRTIEEVLSRPEFRDETTLYERVVRWIQEQLLELIGLLTGGGRAAFLAWAVLLLAGAAVVYMIVKVVGNTSGAGPGRGAAGGASISVSAQTRSSVAWEAEAGEHAAAGRWREAIRCRWRAMVARLAERGTVEEQADRTAGDYRRQVAGASPALSAAFDDATSVFERAWYGEAEVDADEHQRLVDATAALAGDADR
ncbi:MAG: DUF4129 domain-containing protein [Acidimicrobiales bacterium]